MSEEIVVSGIPYYARISAFSPCSPLWLRYYNDLHYRNTVDERTLHVDRLYVV
jgi:hypothetical protein